MCNSLFGGLAIFHLQIGQIGRRDRQRDDFPNESDFQNLVHGFHEVELHGLLDGIGDVRKILFILPRHDRFQDAMAVRGHQLLLETADGQHLAAGE